MVLKLCSSPLPVSLTAITPHILDHTESIAAATKIKSQLPCYPVANTPIVVWLRRGHLNFLGLIFCIPKTKRIRQKQVIEDFKNFLKLGNFLQTNSSTETSFVKSVKWKFSGGEWRARCRFTCRRTLTPPAVHPPPPSPSHCRGLLASSECIPQKPRNQSSKSQFEHSAFL